MATDWTSELYRIGAEDALGEVADFVRGYDEEVPTEDVIEFLESLLDWEIDFAVAEGTKLDEVLVGPEGDDPLEEEDRYLRAGEDDAYSAFRSLRGREPDDV